GFSEASTTYGIIGVKVWVYRGDRLANGDAPVIKSEAGEDDRRPRRNTRPGAPSGRGRPGGDRGPRADGDKPAGDAAQPAAKRVVRKAAPVAGEAKGE
ncbi:MAG: 30S ribosomal protein S3, partial [Burkholderiaceae bacterium]|nr:30S ribosomal protein S3 [Burkholderiaceae bacterium]